MEVWRFPARVEQGEDGAYCWTYDLKANRNDEPFWFMVKVCLAVAGPIALIMAVLTWQYAGVEALLWSLGLLAMMVGLPALIWKLAPLNPSFRMTDEDIEAWPKGRNRNLYAFRSVRSVKIQPRTDAIKLRFTFGGMHVYVPREDYATVREYILARVPEGTKTYWD